MNKLKGGCWERLRKGFGKYSKEIVSALIVTAILAILGYGYTSIMGYFEERPVTAALSADAAGETSIMPVFQIQIRPELSKTCARPNWLAWMGETFFGQHCMRLVFEPHQLEGMITRRLPFKETAEARKLLELFVDHHRGCLSLRVDGETLIIEEPAESQILRETGRLICP